MNVRPPRPVSDDFLALQDAYLSRETKNRGIVDGTALTPTADDPRIVLWQGDITRLKTDAIVNAANSALLGCFQPCHSCIDNIIHTCAGIQLRLACHALMTEQGHEEPTGTAKNHPGLQPALPVRAPHRRAHRHWTPDPAAQGPAGSLLHRLSGSGRSK